MSVVPAAVQKIYARGPKVLLMGLEGSGKTDSIRTLLEAGLKVFCVFLEPGFEVLQDASRGRKVYTCKDGLHWKYIPMAQPSWDDLYKSAQALNMFDFESVSKMPPTNRDKFQAFMQMIGCMSNLTCDRCNERFGPADKLPYNEWCVVNDSLTSISKAALFLHIGSKPAVHKGEYGNAMFNLERYLDKFVGDMPCMGLMLAHVDKEPNEITGGFESMVATLGQKLAPKIPRPFSDVILAKRDGGNFIWSTVDTGVKLKTRNFDFSNKIQPTFVPLVQKWRARIEAEKAAEQANTQLAEVTKK